MAGIFTLKNLFAFIIAPLIFIILVFFSDLEPGKPEVTYTLAIAILMAIWWITEIIPLAVTSLLPVILFPLLGVMDGKDVSATYFNHVIFLFIGGFLVALAMQRWDLHKRIALKLLIFAGASPGRILLGFMLATAFLSMWISNTATAMMMIPILVSVISKLEESLDKQSISKYSIGLLLGVAYSASVGGIATLVGTPPNLSFARIFQIMFPEAPEVSFANWFLFAAPVSVIFFIIIWVYLMLLFKPKKGVWINNGKEVFKKQYHDLGPLSYEERFVFIDFILLAILWLSRSDLQFGNLIIPGWSNLFSNPEYINDGTVAILMSVLLFFIPSKNEKGTKLMNWETAAKIPWNIVLLFGGGFALANGFKESGLSIWFGEQLSWVVNYHPIVIIFIIAITMTFLTELTSNTATTEMLLPILAGLSVSTNMHPLLFMLPATLSASMAFMLPVATPPNAIIFGSGKIRVAHMARAGLWLNLIGAVLVTLATYYYSRMIFGFDIFNMPAWAY
jgi:sodium-dependent dicarboxylate transporter 2/3/5